MALPVLGLGPAAELSLWEWGPGCGRHCAGRSSGDGSASADSQVGQVTSEFPWLLGLVHGPGFRSPALFPYWPCGRSKFSIFFFLLRHAPLRLLVGVGTSVAKR